MKKNCIKKTIVNLAAIGYCTTAMALPLGDGKLTTTTPEIGYVYSCNKPSDSALTSSAENDPWITGDKWSPETKPVVTGAVSWAAKSKLKIVVKGQQRIITANNLPKHKTGVFPIKMTDPAFQYDNNPNSISAQNVSFALPLNPVVASKPSCLNMGPIGFTLTGAALFDALDAGGNDAPAHEIQDSCAGHPEQTGAYHYHSSSTCFSDPLGKAKKHSSLIGYALDGFGIYGLKGDKGVAVTNKDLDICHGHTHTIKWEGKSVSLYHYHLTSEYPYTLGCFKGTPIQMPSPVPPG